MFAVDDLLKDLARNDNARRLDLGTPELRQALSVPPVTSYAEAVRRLFEAYAAREGKPRYGDKTPGYVLHMRVLARLFPEARFIHVIRDGRAVALGYLDQPWGPSTILEGALYWRRRVGRGRAAGKSLGRERYREVRYEDLVAHPEETVRALCPFVGVEFNESMMRYFERGERLRAETAHPEAHHNLTRPPTVGLRDWRSEIPPHDLAVFEVLAGGLLSRLGYELMAGPPSPGAISMAAAAWLGWQKKRFSTLSKRLRA